MPEAFELLLVSMIYQLLTYVMEASIVLANDAKTAKPTKAVSQVTQRGPASDSVEVEPGGTPELDLRHSSAR